MKCDELRPYTIYEGDVGNYTEHVAYNKQDVDEAIAELKAKLDEYVLVKFSTQQMLQNLLDCGLIKEWYFNGKFNFVLKADDPHLQIKELNAKLKESEEERYEAGADAADYYQEGRKQKRALWLARAERAKECKYKYETWERNEERKVYKDYDMIAIVGYKGRTWSKVERKCRAKAEEYK